MNVNDHLNMNMGYNASLNNQTNTQFQSGTFRNVYAVIGGFQSLLHIFTSLLDILYFLKAFKSIVVDIVIKIIKKLLGIIRYLITLRWLIQLIAKTNRFYGRVIYTSKYFKVFSIVFKLAIIMGILVCLFLKWWKTSMLNSLEDETKNKEKEDTNEGNVTSDSIQSKSLEDIHINNKSIMSEERWKFYSDRNNLINKDLK